MLDVTEAYREFKPLCNAKAVVDDLLRSVPETYLTGLRRIVLTNSTALSGRRRRGWSWSRGRKARHTTVRGLYHHRRREDPAWIELFVDKIEASCPPFALKFSFVRSVVYGNVVFHEVGHHIHAWQRPEHREREDVADEWRLLLARAHVRRRHAVWGAILRPILWARRQPRQLFR